MENEKIYYVTEHKVPKTKTRKRFLKDFLERRPTTYTDKECTNIQCPSGKHRSISDLLSIVKSRFKNTSTKAIVRILDELNNDGRCHMMYCTQIKKFVIHGGFSDNGTSEKFLTKYSTKYFKDTIGEDEISFINLMKIRKNLHDEQSK